MHYNVTTTEFEGDCVELEHSPATDPAAYADKTLPVEHFERGNLIVTDNLDRRAQLTEKVHEVVGKAIVVIDQNEHRLSVSKPIALVTYHGRKLEI